MRQWYEDVREAVAKAGGSVTAKEYARMYRCSVDQARHVLNQAATLYGVLRKVTLGTPRAGARYAYEAVEVEA